MWQCRQLVFWTVSTGVRDLSREFRLATGFKPNSGLNPGLEPYFETLEPLKPPET